ncbi:MAG: antibiotic biosynthesis monooxygenase [Puniceicoccales bacterium]|nr:antibiotic biosynthesis monooxygenase [Puniceicoccales bacterium]
MQKIITLIVMLAAGLSARAQVAKDPGIPNPEAPVVFINLMGIVPEDIDQFVADWNERAKIMGQVPGYITATLYRSLLSGARYQLINIAQWQSYDAWVAANNNPSYVKQLSNDLGHTVSIKPTQSFYRPAAWSTNTYVGSFPGSDKQPAAQKGPSLQRVQKDPEIESPGLPFVFINLMEMSAEDISPFVLDWRVRSKIMGQMPAAMGSTLYRALLPDNTYQIVNVSQWQSYDGFIEANNNPAYAQELTSDLRHTPSIKLTRGFYRPVATYTHIYTDVPE